MPELKFDSFHYIFRARTHGYKVAYLTIATIAVVLESLFISDSGLDKQTFVLLLAGYGLILTLAPWLGMAGDILFITVYVLIFLSGHGRLLSFHVLGVCLITAIWIISHHSFAAVSMFISISLLGILYSPDPLKQVLHEIVLAVFTLGISFILRAFKDKETNSQRSLNAAQQESRIALESVRRELAARLHDTIAKDLARVAITAQKLAASHPELAHEIKPLTKITQDASARLRPMIMDLNYSVAAPSLCAAVKESASMLRSREMILNVNMDADIDSLLSRQILLTASLFVREAATNALKYGKETTQVDLYVDIHNNEVALMMSNQISENTINHAFTGGFGLANLQSRIESEGGRMSFASTGTQWIINAAIPNLKSYAEGKNDE